MKKPVALIIMDGFGHTTQKEGSAIDKANIPNIKRLVKELQNSINLSIELSDEGKNSEVSFLREALVFRNLGLEDIEKESISRKEEER